MRDRPLLNGPAGAIILAATAMALVRPAMAEVNLSGGVSVGSQYDTNARQLANIEETPVDDDGKRRRDSVSMNASANVAAKLGGTGPLQGQAVASYNHSDSMDQDALSHDDYTLGLNLDYRPGQVYDVSLVASQTRAPIGLADIGGTSTVEQTATNAQATLRVRPTPRWQLSFSPGWSETQTPLAEADDFRLTTRTSSAAIQFLGSAQLVPGLGATRSESSYSGITNATRYTEQSAFATLNYKVTAVTNFSLSAGKSWRDTKLRDNSGTPGAGALEGGDSAFTGSLGITRQLTAKTGINISAFRNFQQYDAGVNTSIGTGFSVAVNWAATARFSASLGTAYTQSVIDNVAFGNTTIKRTDLERSYSLGMNYLATRMVTVSASATRNVRRSEIWVDQYNSTVGSLSISIAFD